MNEAFPQKATKIYLKTQNKNLFITHIYGAWE